MVNNLDDKNTIADTGTKSVESHTWQLSALSEALGDLTLTVSDSLSVGRGSDNDVVLGSKQVSRNHALLSVLNGKLYMKDLDSSNGTFINDDRIEANKSMPLNTDDHVSFASFSFHVKKPVAAATNANTSDDLSVEHSVLTAAPVTATETPSIDPTPMAMSNAEVTDAKAPLADLDTIAPLEAQPTISSPIEPIVEEETVIDTTFVDDGLSTNDPVATSTADESVVKETMIGEVLSSDMKSTTAPVVDAEFSSTSVPNITTEQETVMSNDTAKVLLNSEPVVKESLVEEPLMKEPLAVESTLQQKAVVEPEREKTTVTSSEHDKTTKTALQEEADPDVLRAKQAATGQFSGTANLGQSRDIGTEGNNALDQAINNSANAGHTEKKPSGSWFIWVFIAIIIIGLALWLFNMGGA